MAKHNDIGNEGERLAAEFLERLGYRIIDRNWRAPGTRHELDIVAMGEGKLVVVEVKTRSGVRHGQPLDAIDKRKARYLAVGANAYVTANGIDLPVRFDLIGITKGSVRHIKDAFVPPATFV